MFIWARPPFLRPQFFVWQGWSPDKWGSLIGVITYFRNQNANFRRDRPAWIRTGHHSVPTIHCSSIRWLHTANIPDTRKQGDLNALVVSHSKRSRQISGILPGY